MTRILSAAITGLDARLIEVEVDLTPGLHVFSIVGLPDKAVQEAKERVSAAIKNSQADPPRKKNQRLKEKDATSKKRIFTYIDPFRTSRLH